MSSNHTENFGLSQWLPTDEFRLEDFNTDNAAIDGALGECLRAMTGSYAGTGVYGSGNPNTLTFDHTPRVVIIQCEDHYGTCVFIWGSATPPMITYTGNGSEVYGMQATYSGNTVNWFSTSGAQYQMNISGRTYNYTALY